MRSKNSKAPGPAYSDMPILPGLMSARARHTWLKWLLPLLILRAFVPAGFMLTWGDDQLQVVLCSGTGPISGASDHADPQASADPHAAHAHHQGGDTAAPTDEHDHSSAQSQMPCAFAVATTAGGLSEPQLFAADADAATIVSFTARPELASPAVLIDRIRGPPRV